MQSERSSQVETEPPGTSKSLETPVLFLIFARPDTTLKVFEEIRQARPKKLFIAADGPRADRPGEAQRCEEARKVVGLVDWPCEVHTLFRENNLGCGRAVSGAITWFFEQVTEGIILEDDTLPSSDFFVYCEELLSRYRNDTRVWGIAGNCLPSSMPKRSEYSYFFSNWDYIWGWATWKRAWDHYDYEVKLYKMIDEQGYFHKNYTSIFEHYFMKFAYERAYNHSDKVTWWDYQWGFARKINSGLMVVPRSNMIVNLGLGNHATNTQGGRWGFLKHEKLQWPLRHPPFVMHDRVTDDEVFYNHITSPLDRIKSKIRLMMTLIGLEKIYLVVRNRK